MHEIYNFYKYFYKNFYKNILSDEIVQIVCKIYKWKFWIKIAWNFFINFYYFFLLILMIIK